MSNDIVWSDFNTDLEKTNNNGVAIYKNNNSVKEAIKNILKTPRGADLMSPYFGTALHKYLFEPLDVITINFLQDMIEKDISGAESRIIVKNVKINQKSDNSLEILVSYSLRNSNLEDSVYYNIGLTNSSYSRP